MPMKQDFPQNQANSLTFTSSKSAPPPNPPKPSQGRRIAAPPAASTRLQTANRTVQKPRRIVALFAAFVLFLVAGCSTNGEDATSPTDINSTPVTPTTQASPAPPATSSDQDSLPTQTLDKPLIIASTSIWADVLHNVTCEGQLAVVVSLMPPGTDPHAYEPSLADREQLGNAALVVANGLGLETGLDDTLISVAEDGTPVLYVGDHVGDMSLPFVEGDDHGHEDDHSDDDHADEDDHDHADEDDHSDEDDHDEDEDDHSDEDDHDHDEDEDEDDHADEEGHDHDEDEDDHADEDGHDHDEDEDHADEDDHDHEDEDDDHAEDDDHGHDEDEDDDHSDEEGHDHDEDEDDHADEEDGHDHEDDDHADDDHADEEDGHDHEDDDHAGHDHGPIDPHIWLDPLLVAETLEEISETLTREAGLDQNSLTPCVNDYETALRDLHENLVEILSEVPPERRKLITNHDAFGYFASRYDFDVAGYVLGWSTLAEPSAARLPELGDLLDETSLPAVFDEYLSVPSDTLQNLVDGRQGVQIATLYTGALGPPDSDAGTYLGMLRSNALIITSALSGN